MDLSWEKEIERVSECALLRGSYQEEHHVKDV